MANAVTTLQNNVADINTTLPNKIDKSTAGDLSQTVSGDFNQTVSGEWVVDSKGDFTIKRDGLYAFYANSREFGIGSRVRSKPITISGIPQFESVSPVNIDDNYAYVTMRTGASDANTKFLVSRTGKIPDGIKPSPRSIEEFQELKKTARTTLPKP